MPRMRFFVTDPTGNHRFIRRVYPPSLIPVIGDTPTPSGLIAKNGRWFKSLGKDQIAAEHAWSVLVAETDELLRLASLGDLPRLSPEQVKNYAEEFRRVNTPPHKVLRLSFEEVLAHPTLGKSVPVMFSRNHGEDFFSAMGTVEQTGVPARFPREGESYQAIVAEIDSFFQAEARRFHVEAEPKPLPVIAAPVGRQRKLTMMAAFDEYVADRVMKPGSVRNIRNACREVSTFATDHKLDWQSYAFNRDVIVHFRYQVMPVYKSDRNPDGPGLSTIKNKLSHIVNFWRWAMQHRLVTVPDRWDGHSTPWDHLKPDAKKIAAERKKFRIEYTVDQIVKLFRAEPTGSDLGDIMRVAFTNGVRREEIAALDAERVFDGGRYYRVVQRIGKNPNAVRIIPLVGIAREIITRRHKAVNGKGPLFPNLHEDEIGKRGGVITQRFLALRRRVLGVETDNKLDFHALRGTWCTAGTRSGVAYRIRARLSGSSLSEPERHERTIVEEMGGWQVDSDLPYDHGETLEIYEQAQRDIYSWIEIQGYLA